LTLFPIEAMLPEKAEVGVSLMIAFAVNAFKRVEAQFPLFHFKSGQINFEIHLATLCKMLVMLTLISTIALNTL